MNRSPQFWVDTAIYAGLAGIVTAQSFQWSKEVSITLAIAGAMLTAVKAKLSPSDGALPPSDDQTGK